MKRSTLKRAAPLVRRTPLAKISAKRIADFARYRAALDRARANQGRICGGWLAWPFTNCRGRLDPHHIYPQGRYPELRAEDWNIVYVCRRHHDLIHHHDPLTARQHGLLKG